jgi:hypothetical protein
MRTLLKINGKQRKLRSEERYSKYYSTFTLRASTLRRVRWAGHVARKGEMVPKYTLFSKS